MEFAANANGAYILRLRLHPRSTIECLLHRVLHISKSGARLAAFFLGLDPKPHHVP